MNARHTTVPGDASQLTVLSKFLEQFWSATDLPLIEQGCFQLALEEIFMNVLMHGSQATPVQVEVSLALVDGLVTLIIEDDGPPFDPLSIPTPDLTVSLETRPVGGLGVFLVRQLMDSVRYQRRGTRNQLQVTKQFVEGRPTSK